MSLENIKIKFGKHKGTELKYLPDSYLEFLYKKGISKGKIKYYTQKRLNLPKDKYKVSVKDSIGCDGDYFIEAYNSNNAINEVKKKYKIQCTQSYHGTEFNATKLN